MQVIINSDSHIDMTQEAVEHWQTEIATSLKRFNDWITRLEVHVTDVNSQAKGGADDIRCLIEARPANQQPVSIEVRGATVEQTLPEAADTLGRRLANLIDKARTEERKRR